MRNVAVWTPPALDPVMAGLGPAIHAWGHPPRRKPWVLDKLKRGEPSGKRWRWTGR